MNDNCELLTEEEIAVTEKAGVLFGDFCNLKTMHRSDVADVCFHIHAIQSIVMARAAMRAYPDKFPERP